MSLVEGSDALRDETVVFTYPGEALRARGRRYSHIHHIASRARVERKEKGKEKGVTRLTDGS